MRQSRTPSTQSAADERREHERRREPVRDGRTARTVSGTTGSTAAIGQTAFVRSDRSASGSSIGVPTVDDRLRLPIELVVEVERETVVARVGGERERERHQRHRAEEERARPRDEASCVIASASRGDWRDGDSES